jgi:glycosyltransferase involved in cell wall biosynthesis
VIRVGFVFTFHDGWLGGINYYRNLLVALYALPQRKIEAVIFTGLRSPENHFDGFPAVKIVRSSMFDTGSILWRIRHIVQHRFPRDYLFEWLLKIHRISVLSHSGWLKGEAAIPTIGWIPDFQHVRLPEFFSKDEIAGRDKQFRNMCQYCSAIIVSSFDAQADLCRFDANCKSKTRVLQFVVSSAKANLALPSLRELKSKFQFSGKYFLLPNQFWKHKNHQVIIEALGLLVSENKKVLILSTGNTKDYRHPEFFESLLARIKELNVGNCFIPLGLVSSDDLAALMLHSSAIINPSLFEGWSTTVEEAKSLGKQVVLSDIPVHREQNPPLANYFLPDDANGLAATLWKLWNSPDKDEIENIESARLATELRRIEFAIQYQQIVIGTTGIQQ